MKLKPIVDSDDFADICRKSHASRTDNLLWRILGGGVTALYVLLFKNKQKNTKIICMSRCVVAIALLQAKCGSLDARPAVRWNIYLSVYVKHSMQINFRSFFLFLFADLGLFGSMIETAYECRKIFGKLRHAWRFMGKTFLWRRPLMNLIHL